MDKSVSCMAHPDVRQASCLSVTVLGLPQLVLPKHICARSKGILHLSPGMNPVPLGLYHYRYLG